jgi:threonine dehydrogenase-like Zn-dependent dehydrogenase
VEIMATGICHTDVYPLEDFESEGIFPSVLGHGGAGMVREVDACVTSLVGAVVVTAKFIRRIPKVRPDSKSVVNANNAYPACICQKLQSNACVLQSIA